MDEFDDSALVGRVARRRVPEEQPGRAFKPWHRPRKQWVRRFQWHASVAGLLREAHFPADGRIMRYLSLPGEDLLDVRVLREACEDAGVELRFTGLNAVAAGSARDIQLNIAESEMRGLAGIHDGSAVVRERFETVANAESLAFAEIRDGGPFHAINIDLCDHLALKPQGGGRHTVIDALAEVIQLQLRNAMHPWLLFVTTRIAPDQIDARNLAALVQAVTDNVLASDEFADRTARLLRREAEALQAALRDPAGLDPLEFTKLFALGFGKWLLRFVGAAHPARELRMLPSCFYAVVPGRPDMLSLGFRCDVVRAPAQDRYELVASRRDDPAAAEIDQGLGILEVTERITNLDAALAEDAQLMEAVTAESADLLRAAHYDVDGDPGYRGWIAAAARPRAA